MASRSTSGAEEPRRYREEDLLPLSGLQHMVFCDRQATLIHVEGVWLDNAYTVEGEYLHRRVDQGGMRTREGTRVAWGVQLVSYRLGLTGKADVVELKPASGPEPTSVRVPGSLGRWTIAPVEYKRGKPKAHGADEVQLCAQAMCLEESFKVEIREGDLFYGTTRRRHPVTFTTELRKRTEEVAAAFHDLVQNQRIPFRFREAKCERCSLRPVCLPPRRTQPRSGLEFLERWVVEVGEEGTP